MHIRICRRGENGYNVALCLSMEGKVNVYILLSVYIITIITIFTYQECEVRAHCYSTHARTHVTVHVHTHALTALTLSKRTQYTHIHAHAHTYTHTHTHSKLVISTCYLIAYQGRISKMCEAEEEKEIGEEERNIIEFPLKYKL